MTNTRKMEDLSVQVKTLVETFKGYDLVLTEGQIKEIQNGTLAICVLTDEMPDKPSEYSYEFMKSFILTAEPEQLLQLITEMRKGMAGIDCVEDFIKGFENSDNDKIELMKRISVRLKEEIGKEIDIDYIEAILKGYHEAYKEGRISRREFGNVAMWESFKELTNETTMLLLFYGIA